MPNFSIHFQVLGQIFLLYAKLYHIKTAARHSETCDTCNQIVDELRDQILKLRFPHRVQNKEATPKTKRKSVGHMSPTKSPSIPAPKPALSDRPCVVVFNKPLEKLLIRWENENWLKKPDQTVVVSVLLKGTYSYSIRTVVPKPFCSAPWYW